jgi:hypothetical protein
MTVVFGVERSLAGFYEGKVRLGYSEHGGNILLRSCFAPDDGGYLFRVYHLIILIILSVFIIVEN